MNHPTAPWNLQGYAILAFKFLDIAKVKAFIPQGLEIVSVLPGKTLGGVYLSAYETGSLLQYNELIVTAGLTRYQDKVSSWISHIYVDDTTSVAGGREIWGLPKEMAEFTWKEDRVEVRQGDRVLCTLQYRPHWFNLGTWWHPQFNASSFGGLETELLQFDNQFTTDLSLLSSQLEIPHDSPFAALDLTKPWLTLKLDRLELIANAPEVVGKIRQKQELAI